MASGRRTSSRSSASRCKIDLPGVGTNLQDRYEVGVVSEVKDDFAIIDGCTFGVGNDPCLGQWRNEKKGPYTTNGVVLACVKKSSVSTGDPDLFVFGAPGYFKGYYPGYSQNALKDKKHFTWAILKAHTGNQAGTVTLRSADPRDMPEIDFKYFDEGTTENNAHERDLQAVAEGVELARSIGHDDRQPHARRPPVRRRRQVRGAVPGPGVRARRRRPRSS